MDRIFILVPLPALTLILLTLNVGSRSSDPKLRLTLNAEPGTFEPPSILSLTLQKNKSSFFLRNRSKLNPTLLPFSVRCLKFDACLPGGYFRRLAVPYRQFVADVAAYAVSSKVSGVRFQVSGFSTSFS